MSDDRMIDSGLTGLHSGEQLLAELNRLRIIAGRRRGKVRLSLQDLETATGVPKSSLANYLTGRTLMPADVLDRLVIALGVSPEESRHWAATWERVTAHRLQSRTRTPSTEGDAPVPVSPRAAPDDLLATGAATPLGPGAAGGAPQEPDDVPGAVAARWADRSPYPGLLPFQEDQAETFYGRELLTARLLELVERRGHGLGMLVVTGASGAGKSSLVRAGLLPAIARGGLTFPGSADWPRLVVTPTSAPLDELAVQLAALAGVDAATVCRTLTTDPDQARLLARQAVLAQAERLPAASQRERCRSEGRLVLVVDQFEELFTATGLAAQQRRTDYLAALLAIATPDGRTGQAAGSVVLTVRGDFLDRCAGHVELVPALQEAQFIVGPMTPAELRRAITGPAAAAGLVLEEGLADEILAELRTASTADDPGTGALPLLSQTMLLTWQYREGNRLTRRGYGRTGGVSQVIEASAETAYQSLPPARRGIARQIHQHLVGISTDGTLTRRQVARDELSGLRQAGAPISADQVTATLHSFAEKRLIVMDRDVVEIAHDVLLRAWPRLRDWLADDRSDRLLHQQLRDDTATWHTHQRDGSFLYRGARLAAAQGAVLRWSARPGAVPQLSDTERAFLAASAHLDRRGLRLRRTVAAVLVLLLLAAGTGAVTASSYAAEAGRQRAIALSRLLALQSRNVDEQPARARRLALAAWSVAPTAEARRAMLDLATRQPTTLVGHVEAVSSVEFSRDGRRLATGSHDGTVRFWDPVTGDPVGRVLRHQGAVGAVTFRADGAVLAVAQYDTVSLWAPATGRRLGVLAVDGPEIKRIDFLDDQRHLAITDSGGSTTVWDTLKRSRTDDRQEWEWTALLRKPASDRVKLTVVAVHPGRRIVVAGYPGEAVRCRSEVGNGLSCPAQIGQEHELTAAGFSPDGQFLATASEGRTVRVWDLNAGAPIGVPLTDRDRSVTAVAFNPARTLLAAGSSDGAVHLWDPSSLHRPVDEPIGFRAGVTALAVDRDRSLLTSLLADGGRESRSLTEAVSARRATDAAELDVAAFGTNGRTLVTATGDDVRWWSPATAAGASWEQRLDGTVTALALTRDGAVLAAADSDGAVGLWDVATRQPVSAPMGGSTGRVDVLTFSPGGSFLASGNDDGVVRLWDRYAGRPIGRPMDTHHGTVTAIAFSPDGRMLATAGDRTVRLWDLLTGTQVGRTLTGHQRAVTAIAFSPDGTILASASRDTTVRLWDPTRSRSIGEPLTGHTGAVHDLVFASDGELLVSGGADRTVRLWNPRRYADPASYLCALVGGPTAEDRSSSCPAKHSPIPADEGGCAPHPGCEQVPTDDRVPGGRDPERGVLVRDPVQDRTPGCRTGTGAVLRVRDHGGGQGGLLRPVRLVAPVEDVQQFRMGVEHPLVEPAGDRLPVCLDGGQGRGYHCG